MNRGVQRVQGDRHGERDRPGGDEPHAGPPAAGLGGARGPGCSPVGEDRFHPANHICTGHHARSSARCRAPGRAARRPAARGAFEAPRRTRHAIVSGERRREGGRHGMSGIQQVVLSGPLILAVPIAAAAGAITFLSPCCLPLVPGYLAYATGMSGTDAQTAPRPARKQRRPAAAAPATTAGAAGADTTAAVAAPGPPGPVPGPPGAARPRSRWTPRLMRPRRAPPARRIPQVRLAPRPGRGGAGRSPGPCSSCWAFPRCLPRTARPRAVWAACS